MDVLSGSYSRMENDMAGTFQVLWGNDDGTFKVAETLAGTDEEPLIIPASEEQITEKICTRATAADVNGDGNLDLVVGNFGGSFYVFTGEGKGAFAPKPEKLSYEGKDLHVDHHSDPFIVDWDADGDLDIVSGSDGGGVFLSTNDGTKTDPEFTAFVEVIASAGRSFGKNLSEDDLTGPQGSTRVWVEDLNNDGKLDLLVGDSVQLSSPAEGLTADESTEKLAAWDKEMAEINEAFSAVWPKLDELGEEDESDDDATKEARAALEKEMEEMNEKMQSHYEKRSDFVIEKSTGYVWAYYQK